MDKLSKWIRQNDLNALKTALDAGTRVILSGSTNDENSTLYNLRYADPKNRKKIAEMVMLSLYNDQREVSVLNEANMYGYTPLIRKILNQGDWDEETLIKIVDVERRESRFPFVGREMLRILLRKFDLKEDGIEKQKNYWFIFIRTINFDDEELFDRMIQDDGIKRLIRSLSFIMFSLIVQTPNPYFLSRLLIEYPQEFSEHINSADFHLKDIFTDAVTYYLFGDDHKHWDCSLFLFNQSKYSHLTLDQKRMKIIEMILSLRKSKFPESVENLQFPKITFNIEDPLSRDCRINNLIGIIKRFNSNPLIESGKLYVSNFMQDRFLLLMVDFYEEGLFSTCDVKLRRFLNIMIKLHLDARLTLINRILGRGSNLINNVSKIEEIRDILPSFFL